MKLFHAFAILTAFAILAMIGCDSGIYQYYTGGGLMCDESYDPLPTKITDGSAKPVPALTAPGNYIYQGSQAFFRDRQSDVFIHIQETVDAQGNNPVDSRPCVRNIQNYKQAPQVELVKTVRSISINNGKMTINTQDIGYNFDNKTLNPVIIVDKANFTGDIASVYKSQSEQPGMGDPVIYCMNPCNPTDTTKNYQIRSSRTMDKPPFETVEVVVSLQWTAPPPAKK